MSGVPVWQASSLSSSRAPSRSTQPSLNNLTAKPNSDGSYTIRFGGCGNGVENCLPIMSGWNYAVRMYEPSKAIVEGTWTFPGPPKPRAK